MKKIAVIGTGAVGGYYGGLLAKAGENVFFLLRSDYSQVSQHGLKVDSKDGDFHLSKVNAYQNPTDMPRCDIVLVALKATHNHLLENILPAVLKEDSYLILIQNGLGQEALIHSKIKTAFPRVKIFGGLAFICAEKIAAGHIRHIDYGGIRFAPYISDSSPSAALVSVKTESSTQVILDEMKLLFKKATIPASSLPNLNEARWRKLVWNIPYNGLSVILNTRTSQLMRQPESRKLVETLMWETVRAAQACGLAIEDAFVETMLSDTDKMKDYAPSMKIDFDAGRELETEAIYGMPIAQAHSVGVNMPCVEMLYRQLKFATAKQVMPSH